MDDLKNLLGLGPKSQQMLRKVGITTLDDFLASDVYELYARLKASIPGTSLNMLYAMIGAQESRHWIEIKNERRMEILLRLDEMGLAPKK